MANNEIVTSYFVIFAMPTFLLTGLMAFFILTGSAGFASAPQIETHSVSLTGYNAVPSQTDDDPSVTASGMPSDPDVVAARSRDLADVLPYGTVIAIEPDQDSGPYCGLDVVGNTIGYRVITDNMNARITNTVDILFDVDDTVTIGTKSVNAARVLGICENVTIRVVGQIELTKPSQFPKTQAELAAMVGSSGLALK